MEMSLDQLRAENAQAEGGQAQDPQPEHEQQREDAGEQVEQEGQSADQGHEGETGELEDQSWMQTEETQESSGAGEKKFTDRDVGAAKAKLRAKLDAQHRTELDQLKEQLEAERRKNAAPQQTPRPSRDQFYEHDDPEEAYLDALTDWKIQEQSRQSSAQNQQYEQQRQHIEFKQRLEQDVDKHYHRASELAAKSGISPEAYQQADLRVRSALESVTPGFGEHNMDVLIATLGEGSERVMYNLGVNPGRLNQLADSMRQDPSGLKAVAYLSKLSAELAPAKRKSNAPPPAASAKGDMGTADVGASLLKRYKAAHADRDYQLAMDIRREAKAKGANTSTW